MLSDGGISSIPNLDDLTSAARPGARHRCDGTQYRHGAIPGASSRVISPRYPRKQARDRLAVGPFLVGESSERPPDSDL